MPVSKQSVVRIEITEGKSRMKDGKKQRKFYFHPVAGNNEQTGSSEAYTTKAHAKRAAARLFPDLPIEDTTG